MTSAWTAVVVGAALGVAGCTTTNSVGLVECYGFARGTSDFGTNGFRIKGMAVKRLDPDCPRIKKVRCELWVDSNGNGLRDAQEKLLHADEVNADPPSQHVGLGSFSGSLPPARGTAWRLEIVGEQGELTTMGGTF